VRDFVGLARGCVRGRFAVGGRRRRGWLSLLTCVSVMAGCVVGPAPARLRHGRLSPPPPLPSNPPYAPAFLACWGWAGHGAAGRAGAGAGQGSQWFQRGVRLWLSVSCAVCARCHAPCPRPRGSSSSGTLRRTMSNAGVARASAVRSAQCAVRVRPLVDNAAAVSGVMAGKNNLSLSAWPVARGSWACGERPRGSGVQVLNSRLGVGRIGSSASG
jgi:hypothetical protein